MAELPDYYMDLGVEPGANQQEVEKVYRERVAALRASTVEDAPEELAEVEAAYAVLHDPGKRSSYDARLKAEDAAEDKKDAELNAYLQSQHRRSKRNRRTGSWLGALLDLLDFFK
ncbi:MAG TPA: DnaJ domain-containing protein [Candidatus Binatia bacterium]|nr:DnaJ domain-containing protein [Candidatus Binatia bacterium]